MSGKSSFLAEAVQKNHLYTMAMIVVICSSHVQILPVDSND